MRNAGLDELQADIKVGRIGIKVNISNFRYADDTPLMAKSEEEHKDLLMRVKEESERADLRLNIIMCIMNLTQAVELHRWLWLIYIL